MKTHKGAAARFRVSGTGKLMRMKGGSSHLRRKKSYRAKKLYDQTILVSDAVAGRIRRTMPYL